MGEKHTKMIILKKKEGLGIKLHYKSLLPKAHMGTKPMTTRICRTKLWYYNLVPTKIPFHYLVHIYNWQLILAINN